MGKCPVLCTCKRHKPSTWQRKSDEPLLGLATTAQLLEEVAARMEITQNSTNGREIGRLCRGALTNLASSVLAYRTVGPSDIGDAS